MPKKREVQPEDFEILLSWLDPNRDAAGLKYESIRRRLIKIFVCRGCPDPETLADETIDRVTVKVKNLAAAYIGDAPELYFYGVARLIYLESLRRGKNTQTALHLIKDNYLVVQKAEGRCLDECLQKLPPEQERLFLAYYENEQKTKKDLRRELAGEFKIDVNLLRVKIYRIKQILQNCVEKCLKDKSEKRFV